MSLYTDVVDADSPTAHWRLGETSGTSAVDRIAVAANGTYTGGYTLNQASPIITESTKGIVLNGTTGYVNLGTPVKLTTALASANAITFEAWVWPSVNNVAMQWLCSGSDGSAWRFSMTATGKIEAFLPYVAGWIQVSSTTTINAAGWHHVAYTYDGTTVRFYLDGQPDGTSTNARTMVFASKACAIGRYGDFGGAYFNGNIDEVAVYKSALSAARILAHYEAGVGKRGAAALTGTGSLTATGGQTLGGDATLSGAGSLTADGVAVVFGAASLTGTGDLTADALRAVDGAAALTGTGDLSASGDRQVDGAATLEGAGDLSAEGVRSTDGASALTGTGDLTAAGDRTLFAAATLTGAGDLSADGDVFDFWTGEATLPGSGTLVATGTRLVFAQAVLGASGDLSAEGVATKTAQAFLLGAGDLTAVGVIVGFITGSATLTGRGSLRVGLPQGPFGAVVTRDRTKVRVTSLATDLVLTTHKTNAEV